MGLLDSLTDKLKSALGSAKGGGTAAFVSQLLTKTDFGDLPGIVATLEEAGLGTQVKSWLGDGRNLPISGDQLRAALNNEQVQQIARHLGLPVDAAMNQLAEHLPTAVDQASPNGTLSGTT
jgi:uncharacterized protein YidB (DUF937 family)